MNGQIEKLIRRGMTLYNVDPARKVILKYTEKGWTIFRQCASKAETNRVAEEIMGKDSRTLAYPIVSLRDRRRIKHIAKMRVVRADYRKLKITEMNDSGQGWLNLQKFDDVLGMEPAVRQMLHSDNFYVDAH